MTSSPLLLEICARERLGDALAAAIHRPYLASEAETLLPDEAAREEFLAALGAELRAHLYVPRPPRIMAASHPTDPARRIVYEQLRLREWVVEHAVRGVLISLYEPVFVPTSCAHRGRGARRRLAALAERALRDGGSWFACGDVEAYFQSIDRHLLFDDIEIFTADSAAANLVGTCFAMTCMPGLPPGHVLSPFLSNVYLHPIDICVDIQPIIRFADDIFLPRPTQNAADAALKHLEQLLAKRGLRLNLQKRKVVHLPDVTTLLQW